MYAERTPFFNQEMRARLEFLKRFFQNEWKNLLQRGIWTPMRSLSFIRVRSRKSLGSVCQTGSETLFGRESNKNFFFPQKPVIPRWDRRGGGGARVIFLKCSIIPSIRIHSSTLLTCLMCYEQFATSSNLANHIKICFKAGLKNKWSGIKRLALSELTVISDGRTDGQRNRG